MKRSQITGIFVILFFAGNLELSAQKVGVVLSGGGAKGSAHVGVLKALEDNCIPIHYIAGTSMGAIVGSMYASGYSPEQIEKIITSEEFLNWAKGTVDDRYIYFFKQDDPDASWINLKFNYDSILSYKLPTNIISPYQVDFGFMYFLATAGAAANNNFDSLFIPFRCVAADIADKKAVIFSEGNLAEAVRASMTYPFYFKPIKINGKLLWDGGMYNNFPADVMYRDFFPDIIIGCNVASNSEPPDENDIMSQIENMLTTNTNYDVICENGVMIQPKLPKVSEFEFQKAKELIRLGYEAAIAKIPEIRKFVTDSMCKGDYTIKRAAFNMKKPAFKVDSIEVEGVNRRQASYIYKSIFRKEKIISAEALKLEYFKLLADDKIESIYPRASFNRNTGYFSLRLDVKRDKNFVAQFGGLISSSNINGAYVGLQYKYFGLQASKLSFNFYIGRFFSGVQIKNRVDFPDRLPFSWESSVSINQWDYFKTTIRFFEDKTPSYLVQTESNFITEFGFPVYNKGKFVFGAGVAHKKDQYYQTNMFTKTDTADKTYFDLLTAQTQFHRQTLNRKQYPTQGMSFFAQVRYVIGNEENIPGSTSVNKEVFETTHQWIQLRVVYDRFFKKWGPYSLGMYAEGMISNKPLFHNYTSSLLSAPVFQPTPESEALFLPSYRANIFAAAGIKNIINIYKKIHFRLEGYIFQPYQEIRSNDDFTPYYGKPLETRSFLGYAALVYQSPLCPISISLSYYHEKEEPFSVMFKIGYIFFNKRIMD